MASSQSTRGPAFRLRSILRGSVSACRFTPRLRPFGCAVFCRKNTGSTCPMSAGSKAQSSSPDPMAMRIHRRCSSLSIWKTMRPDARSATYWSQERSTPSSVPAYRPCSAKICALPAFFLTSGNAKKIISGARVSIQLCISSPSTSHCIRRILGLHHAFTWHLSQQRKKLGKT